MENPEKSLHGILYCINNGRFARRIEKEEIDFILELNWLYGKNDILIIVFTQSINPETEVRIKQLHQGLNIDKLKLLKYLLKKWK